MASIRMPAEEARISAQRVFGKAEQREKGALREKDKAFAAVSSKTARLRSLRMAKEASDKAAAEQKESEKKPAKRASGDGT